MSMNARRVNDERLAELAEESRMDHDAMRRSAWAAWEAEAVALDLRDTREEITRLREALLAHRADLHEYSKRPCPTCRQSAKVLGIKVPDSCARAASDRAALAPVADDAKGENDGQ